MEEKKIGTTYRTELGAAIENTWGRHCNRVWKKFGEMGVEAEGSLGAQWPPPFMEEPERSCPVLEVVASETSFLLNFPDSSKHEIVSRYYFCEQKEIIVNK